MGRVSIGRLDTRSRSFGAAVLLVLALLLGGPLGLADSAADRVPAPQSAPEPTLEALMRAMAGTSGVVASFREVKVLALLSAPIEVRGTLYFVPPDRLSRITSTPARSRLVIDGDRFTFRDAAGDEEIDLGSNPLAREFVANFIVLFNGDLEALRERYEPDFEVGEGHWTLTLRPRRRPLADVVEHVTLRGEARTLTGMELVEVGGDSTTTWFDEVQTDYRFSEAELERLFAGSDAARESP